MGGKINKYIEDFKKEIEKADKGEWKNIMECIAEEASLSARLVYTLHRDEIKELRGNFKIFQIYDSSTNPATFYSDDAEDLPETFDGTCIAIKNKEFFRNMGVEYNEEDAEQERLVVMFDADKYVHLLNCKIKIVK